MITSGSLKELKRTQALDGTPKLPEQLRSLAMFTAMRHASSRVSSLAAACLPGSCS